MDGTARVAGATAGADGARKRYRAPTLMHEIATADVVSGLSIAELLGAPAKLYAAGDLELLHRVPRVAIIGARKASEDGIRRAKKLASLLGREKITIVSGLALGIDKAAHEGVIAAGGRTIAVIGTPLDRAYPHENADLQELIAREHLLVSQFPRGARTLPTSFVRRNLTMALLSHASVIVECSDTSGSLSQARETVRLGHPLFIARSMVERTDVTWPARFLAAKQAQIFDDAEQILAAVRP